MKYIIAIAVVLSVSTLGWSYHQMNSRSNCVWSAESVAEWKHCSMPGRIERTAQVVFGPITGM